MMSCSFFASVISDELILPVTLQKQQPGKVSMIQLQRDLFAQNWLAGKSYAKTGINEHVQIICTIANAGGGSHINMMHSAVML